MYTLPAPGLSASLPLASDTAILQPQFSGHQASHQWGQKDVCTRGFPTCPGDIGFSLCISQLEKGFMVFFIHIYGATVTSSGWCASG